MAPDTYSGVVLAVGMSVVDATTEAAAAVLQAAATAAGPAGMFFESGMEQESQLHAYYPLALRACDRSFELNLTGHNGFGGINGRSYMMPPLAPYAPNPYPLCGAASVCAPATSTVTRIRCMYAQQRRHPVPKFPLLTSVLWKQLHGHVSGHQYAGAR